MNEQNRINECPVCKSGIGFKKINIESSTGNLIVDCNRCNSFLITQTLINDQTSMKKIADNLGIFSGYLKNLADRSSQLPILKTDNLDTILEDKRIPNKSDIELKGKLLLQWIKNNTSYFGEPKNISLLNDFPVCYASNSVEFRSFIDLLDQQNYLTIISQSGENILSVKLTDKGYIINGRIEDSNQIFIASWFDDSQMEAITTMEKAISEIGYSAMCIKDKDYPETILDKGLGEIRRSRAVVADLTGMRPAVLFEVGFAYALNIPIIYVKNKTDKTEFEFYTSNYIIHEYGSSEELLAIVKSSLTSRLSIN